MLLIFSDLAQLWLDVVAVSPATEYEYAKAIKRYWLPAFVDRSIVDIRYSQIAKVVKAIPWSSAKTRNNALIPLRGIFELAFLDELIDRNPMARIKNAKHQRALPDPFTRDEAEIIIDYLYDRYSGADAVYPAYFELMFFSGLRTSEALALLWTDIDFRTAYMRIEKAQSKGRLNDKTKTATVRDVLLNERALHALNALKPLTLLRGAHLFVSPRTCLPYATEKAQRLIFSQALKKLGIRHRPAYNTRHSYATMLLMAGANPHFVAAQLGHSVVMTLTVYSRWLRSENDWLELQKLDFGERRRDGRDGRI